MNKKVLLIFLLGMPSFINSMRPPEESALQHVAMMQGVAIREIIASFSRFRHAQQWIHAFARESHAPQDYITFALGLLYAPHQGLTLQQRTNLIVYMREQLIQSKGINPISSRVARLLKIIELLSSGDVYASVTDEKTIDDCIQEAVFTLMPDSHKLDRFWLHGIQDIPNSIDEPLVIVTFTRDKKLRQVKLRILDIACVIDRWLFDAVCTFKET